MALCWSNSISGAQHFMTTMPRSFMWYKNPFGSNNRLRSGPSNLFAGLRTCVPTIKTSDRFVQDRRPFPWVAPRKRRQHYQNKETPHFALVVLKKDSKIIICLKFYLSLLQKFIPVLVCNSVMKYNNCVKHNNLLYLTPAYIIIR